MDDLTVTTAARAVSKHRNALICEILLSKLLHATKLMRQTQYCSL